MKGNLSLFRIYLSDYVPQTSQVSKSVFVCVCDIPFQMAAQVCAVGMDAVPWNRAVGAASARLDGVGLDAALSWKLTAVMEQTTTEVTFLISSIIFCLFFPFISVSLADCPFHNFVLLFLLPRSLHHCSSPASLCAVSVVLRLL